MALAAVGMPQLLVIMVDQNGPSCDEMWGGRKMRVGMGGERGRDGRGRRGARGQRQA